ncbi:Thiosulfate sulfurtransferase GlpE [Ferriphaselus amnicola]|uniref:Thiosulfate sulfurtransferase GlpE n=1 Tax=Ferriphaselus amnicola TaxID=1188319 RepID=A0A2Z6GCV8_9PROT|nr:rhodanese-like domain-containing protein [Ferriphaselus amnicola]BBE51358.1 Thiosulfate sulfurtransferase GlpE [Ferriphaselus amnicola]
MTSNGFVLGIIAVLGVFFLMRQLQAADGIDVTEAQKMNQNGALLLDVREPGEYASGHAPNAVLIPLGQLGSRMQEITAYKDKPVAVMCRSGRRSASATKQLAEAGFSQVKNVNGGIMAWEQAGLPVVR